jgi:hypothetical protein
MKTNRYLLVLAALVITLSLLQTGLVFACSSTGDANGQGDVNGNGDPGGNCFGATHGLTFGISSDPRCGGTNAGPASLTPLHF